MKKTLVAKLALAGTVGLVAALASGSADASCNGCHTMHNSQNGASMRYDGGSTPLAVLLKGTCYACHSGENTSAAIVATQPPKVFKTTAGAPTSASNGVGTHLAGGDFYWVNTLDRKGHNISGLTTVTGADDVLGTTPPGGTDLGSALQCAGSKGCHGLTSVWDPMTAMNGAHHSPHNTINSDLTALTTVGGSYRYLKGVDGQEDTNWEYTYGAGDHNVYAGVNRNSTDTLAAISISNLCARCHGSYHAVSTGGNSYRDAFGINESNLNFAGTGKWIRHPTDYSMPTTVGTEYVSYTAYKYLTPVGKTAAALNVAAVDTVNSADTRVVLCLSCHRAHGSQWDDMLRFNYDAMDVGSGKTGGCFNCHSFKN